VGEKDATEPKRGANAVADSQDAQADALQTPGTSEATLDVSSETADHAENVIDTVDGDGAPIDVAADHASAPANVIVTDDVAPEAAGVTADASDNVVAAAPRSPEDVVVDDAAPESGAVTAQDVADDLTTAAVDPHDAATEGSADDDDVTEAAVSEERPAEELAEVAVATDLEASAAASDEVANADTISDDDPTEAAVSDDPPAADFAAQAVIADAAPAAEVSGEDATADVDVAEGLEEDPATDAAAITDTAAEDGAAENFEPPARASAELKAILEALIFASPEPLSLKALTRLLDSEPKEDVASALVGLKDDYDRPGGLQLVEVAGGYQIVTRHDLHEWVRRLFHERSTQKLSAQALETLAVVAYRQPITAVEITEIRGVNTSGVLNTLLERHLIKIVGRKAVVGRPFMYSTTKEFLIRFGLNDLTDLPRVEDMVDALGLEAPLLIEQAPLEDQLPLEEPDTESDEASAGVTGEAGESGDFDDPEDPRGGGGPDGSVH
jgi:segregation and condensation protein B